MSANLKSYSLPDRSEQAKQAAQTLRESDLKLSKPPAPPLPVQMKLVRVLLVLKFFKNLIFANPEELHGKYYITPQSEEHSRLTARVISVGSIFNAITNQPLLFFAFKDFGMTLGLSASLILNLLIIKFTNDNGTAVAGRKYSHRAWSKVGAWGMIAMSIVQSVAAPVGMEAMNNSPELARLKATELIERQTQTLEDMPVTTIAYERARQEYQDLLQKFQGMSRSQGNWDTDYVRLFGAWEDRDRDWSGVPTENLPLEQRMLRLQQEAGAAKEQAQRDWGEKLAKRQQLGDDVLFLQAEMPQLFALNFESNYELRSGTETVRLAALNLYNKLIQGDLAGLGFPLLFMFLSVITSGVACGLTLAHAQREDVAMSRDEAVGEAINAHLEYLIRAADETDDQQSSQVE
ncbi:hypothetical protein [Limnoraphis robusta]|uniref:Uncharacterized protein n=1 Tax=Limnoraphis robusta CCNP1315 TaxID=3110306 RepID=A0ABU5U814_9CYAN|nr:hypothetical protein [Limnoraphis robusta]MEA5523304.1 hypothetical protein [Limnoraphis robusta CCNP1315]MEA5544483.1 hypothetical protein [Limnoraphis robusta CCNP1324]